jgi:hypothetical protein
MLVMHMLSSWAIPLQCSDLVKGLTPALVEWLRANASPEVLCADAGVCATPTIQSLLQASTVPTMTAAAGCPCSQGTT